METLKNYLSEHVHKYVALGSYPRYPNQIVIIQECSTCKNRREIRKSDGEEIVDKSKEKK